MLAGRRALHAIDRRGRGIRRRRGSVLDRARAGRPRRRGRRARRGDRGPVDVLEPLAGRADRAGASLRTRSIRRLIAYERARVHDARAGERDELLDALRDDLARGDNDALPARFMTEAVGMPPADLAAFRADPIWPLRSAAAPTIVREVDAADAAPEVSLDALAAVSIPALGRRVRVAGIVPRGGGRARRAARGRPARDHRRRPPPPITATRPKSSPSSRRSSPAEAADGTPAHASEAPPGGPVLATVRSVGLPSSA